MKRFFFLYLFLLFGCDSYQEFDHFSSETFAFAVESARKHLLADGKTFTYRDILSVSKNNMFIDVELCKNNSLDSDLLKKEMDAFETIRITVARDGSIVKEKRFLKDRSFRNKNTGDENTFFIVLNAVEKSLKPKKSPADFSILGAARIGDYWIVVVVDSTRPPLSRDLRYKVSESGEIISISSSS